jgi:hypothetical protein
MRSLILPLLLLTIAACTPPAGTDPNGTMAGPVDAQPLPMRETTVLFGRCARTSWVSGALAIGGKRHRLTCEQAGFGYLPRKPGHTDTTVSVLQKDEAERIELRALWESRERLTVHFATLGDGEAVQVRGECRGVFVRPPDRYLASGGTEMVPDGDDADYRRQNGKTIDCTVSDLQGNVIGAISFQGR